MYDLFYKSNFRSEIRFPFSKFFFLSFNLNYFKTLQAKKFHFSHSNLIISYAYFSVQNTRLNNEASIYIYAIANIKV